MVFSSVVFLCLFLPVVFVVYQILPSIRLQNGALLLASLVFYAFGRIEWVPILLFSAVWNYFAGRLVARPGKSRKAALVGAIFVNLLVLCVFKYLDFGLGIVNSLFRTQIPLPGIELPIGISFFTFQGMSYVIDVYRNPASVSKNLGKVMLYISLFPQLVAGPIIKYLDIAQQIDHRTVTPEKTAQGIVRFVLGLSKKLLVANTLGQAADAVYSLSAGQLDFRLAWLGAICYTLQIYFDFSGYSDMAIGLGRMFGFSFKENFLHPYKASSIKEFWRCWHISLSSWFRDYVYIPLGGNRRGMARARWNRLFVFFLTGLWHGANWTFILWGLWHGLLLLLEDKLRLIERLRGGVISHLYTMLAVTLGFMLFRADSLTQAWEMLRAMFTGISMTPESHALFWNLASPILGFTLIVAVIGSLPVLNKLYTWAQKNHRAGKALQSMIWPGTILLLVLDFFNLAATSFNPFIYFQF